ncbi:MAG: TolC family protein [Alphaproteobacteria bacterium]
MCLVVLGHAALALAQAPPDGVSVSTLLPSLIQEHDRVAAARAGVDAAEQRARSAWGGWYPEFEATHGFGREKQQKPTAEDTNTSFGETNLRLTQLLWDFGATNSVIEKARLQLEGARARLLQARQAVVLEGVTAFLNVRRSVEVRDFARQSEENIRRQTGLEEARVEQGAGLSTDVLQAKTQLAGAQARHIQTEGAVIQALNRYRAVFGYEPTDIKNLETVPLPAALLPDTLEHAIALALQANPDIQLARIDATIADESINETESREFAPTLQAIGEHNRKRNVAGTIGKQNESIAKVELRWQFNLGLTAINTLRASQADHVAAARTVQDVARRVEEATRNAWQQFDTARRTAESLNLQAQIAGAFLDLARQERTLGQRSLIDVLQGETSLINAQSDAVSAETDVLIAAYNLLGVLGQLEPEVVKGGP